MSFGYKDSDWIDPPDPPIFRRNCIYCIYFQPCPCGCNWGLCSLDRDEMFDGTESGCDEGCPYDGIYEDPIDEDAEYERWRDNKE